MRRKAAVLLIAVAAAALSLRSDGQAGQPAQGYRAGAVEPSKVIVRYREAASEAERAGVRGRSGAAGHRSLHHLGLDVLHLPPGRDLGKVLDALSADPDVEYAEADARVEFLSASREIPPDPDFDLQWSLDYPSGSPGYFATSSNPVLSDVDIDAPEGWAVLASAYGAAGNAAVGVLDSGCGEMGAFSPSLGYLPNHQDLPNASLFANTCELSVIGVDSPLDDNALIDDVNGWDWAATSNDGMPGNDNTPADSNTSDRYHGTAISGIVSAAWGTTGMAGIGRDRVVTLPLRGHLISDYVEAIDYAIGLRRDGHPVRVLNASWKIEGGFDLQSLRDAVSQANADGIALVAAAGNDGSNNDDFVNRAFPAEYTRIPLANVLAVSATNSTGFLAETYSNYGPRSVQLAAPGDYLWTVAGSSSFYAYYEGTSFSAPVAASVLAHVMAAFPSYTPAEAIGRVIEGGDFDARLAGLVSSGKRVNLAGALAPFHPYSGVAYMGSTRSIALYGDAVSAQYGSIIASRRDPAWSTSVEAAVIAANGAGGWAVSPKAPGIASFVLSFESPSAPVGSYATGPWRVTAIRPFSGQVTLGQTLTLQCLLPGTASWSVFDTSVGTIAPVTASTAVFTPLAEGETRIALSVEGSPVDVSGWFAVESPTPKPGGSGGGCFVATASWGDEQAAAVRVLRKFRDDVLLATGPGRAAVGLYYRESPSAAAFLNRHPAFKPLVRWLLWPIVLGVWLAMTGWFVPAVLAVFTLALAGRASPRQKTQPLRGIFGFPENP